VNCNGKIYKMMHDDRLGFRSLDTGTSVRADFALSFVACASILRNPHGFVREVRVIDGSD